MKSRAGRKTARRAASPQGGCRRQYWLNFSGDLSRRPLLWRLGRELPVIFDVRSAQVTDQGGLMAVELTGTAEMLDRAVGWLRRHHVGVSPAI